MKSKNHFAMTEICLTFAMLTISQIDANSLEEIMECQKLFKEHRNYSYPNIIPISDKYANPFIASGLSNSTKEAESLIEIERKEDFKILLTIQDFKNEIQQWRKEILSCPTGISIFCSNESAKLEIERLAYRVTSLDWFYTISAVDAAKQNRTKVYEQIAQDKKMLADIEATQLDLCASGDSACQVCLEEKADESFTKGVGCNTYRQWHLIKYKPIQYNRCKGMKQLQL